MIPAPPIRAFVVFGTRPEAVKLLGLIDLLRDDRRFAATVVTTGQHRDMPAEILTPFGVEVDVDLGLMRPGQTLNEMTARMIPAIDDLYSSDRPHMVVVQGDTTSAFAAALTAFHRGIPVAHVEAGLRSFDRFHPYPEEANRRMLSCVADLHFAPTPRAAENLLREGVPRQEVMVTGNTVIDALHRALEQVPHLPGRWTAGAPRRVLVTLHRRESWEPLDGGNAPLENILNGVCGAARAFPDVEFVYPVHHNPRVRGPVEAILGDCGNVRLLDPQPYIEFVALMASATVILTDSGGIQEEAPSLGVPVLVLRRTTERPEGMPMPRRLLGDSPAHLLEQLTPLLEDPPARPARIPQPSPFGDGRAGERIRDGIVHFMGMGARPDEFGQPRPMQLRAGPGPRRRRERRT